MFDTLGTIDFLGGKLFGLRVVWPGHSACWLFSFWALGSTLLGPFGIKVGIVNFVPQRKESKRFPHIDKNSSLGNIQVDGSPSTMPAESWDPRVLLVLVRVCTTLPNSSTTPIVNLKVVSNALRIPWGIVPISLFGPRTTEGVWWKKAKEVLWG